MRWLPLLGLCLACAAPAQEARRELAQLRDVVRAADAQRAYVCAPRELALARAHLSFAERSLDRGDVRNAQAHLRLADPNAHAALRLSPRERCAESASAVTGEEDRDGDGVVDGRDRCPEEAGEAEEDGCPVLEDGDGDGVADARDLCPWEAEDRDGRLDDDGCPDLDDDLDGVPDATDLCPRAPEDPDGFRDGDGCPDPDDDEDGVGDLTDRCPDEAGPAAEAGCPRRYEGVVVSRRAIVLETPLRFAAASARLLPRSFGALNAVAQVLRDTPSMRLEIRVRPRSPAQARLAAARADALRSYLVRLGIAEERLRNAVLPAGEGDEVAFRRTDGTARE
ncbi:MAG: thrombospondin type 3 repeat-containing protein [Myxococcota bacterium]